MDLKEILIKNKHRFTEVISGIRSTPCILLDLSPSNKALHAFDLSDPAKLEAYVLQLQEVHRAVFSIGKYHEDRCIYDHSSLFGGSERRSVHMGLDIFTKENTPVFAPLAGLVHSYRHNDAVGDYGPTIVLEHRLEGTRFYTLYGHLSLDAIQNIQLGTPLAQGQAFCKVGGYPLNGNWPPHLHFQVIAHLGDYHGDFPGVCKPKDVATFLKNCPDPNLILQIPLKKAMARIHPSLYS